MLRKVVIASLSVLLFLLLASGAYVYTLINQTSQALVENGDTQVTDPQTTNSEDPSTDSPFQDYAVEGIENILILGLDRRLDDDVPRSDAIMIATVDNKNDNLKLTSLMRDMYVAIPGHRNNKLNSAFAFGGVELATETINYNFHLNIERYVTLDFNAFEGIIDAIGGVTIEVSSAEVRAINRNLNNRPGANVSNLNSYALNSAGVQTLNGRQALAYARIRDVGNNDFERVERQQKVLSVLFEEVQSLSPLRFPALLSTILPHVETNFTAFELLSKGTTVLGFNDKQIHRFRLPVDGAYSSQTIRGGASALVPDLEKNRQLLHEFLNTDPTVTE